MPRRKVQVRHTAKFLGILVGIAGILGTVIAVMTWTADRPQIQISLKVDPLVFKKPDGSLENMDFDNSFRCDLVAALFRKPIASYLERHKLPSEEFERTVLETRKQLIERFTGITVCLPYQVSIANNGARDTTIVSALLTVDAVADTNVNLSKITLANNESVPSGSLREYKGTLEFPLAPDPNLYANPLDTWVDKSIEMWVNIKGFPKKILLYELEHGPVDYVFTVACEDQHGNRTAKLLTLEQVSVIWQYKRSEMKMSQQSVQTDI